jgi:phytoene dehydrogenase-like protein
VIDQITSYRRPSPISGLMARAVMPAAVTPTLLDRPQQPSGQHSVSIVALAPAAMTALIQAQERLSQDAPALEREQTAAQIDQLMYQLNEAPQGAYGSGPMTVRQLRVSRDALSQSLIDLQA